MFRRQRQSIAFGKDGLLEKAVAAAIDQSERHVDTPLGEVTVQFPFGAEQQFKPVLPFRTCPRHRCGDDIARYAGKDAEAQGGQRLGHVHGLHRQVELALYPPRMSQKAGAAAGQFHSLIRAHEQSNAQRPLQLGDADGKRRLRHIAMACRA